MYTQIDGTITGQLSPGNAVISGTITNALAVGGELTIPISGIYPVYDGGYEVTPLAGTEQILATHGKRMEDDVVVLAIPYYETTNESGGYTAIIG